VLAIRRNLRVAAVLASLVACRSSTASVQGDVFLVTQNGEIKRGAGDTVLLLPSTDSLRQLLVKTCSTYADRMGAILRWADSLGDQDILGRVLVRNLLKSDATANADSSRKWLRKHFPTFEDTLQATRDLTVEHVEAILNSGAIARMSPGIDAHYRFSNVRPGPYLLVATTAIEGRAYHWLAAVTAHSGDSITHNLDNVAAGAGETLYCTADSPSDSLAVAYQRLAFQRLLAEQEKK